MVCYGMISALPADYENPASHDIPPGVLVNMESANCLTSADYGHFKAQSLLAHTQMLNALVEDSVLKLFVTCTPSKVVQKKTGGPKRSDRMPCTLDVVVYGPAGDICEEWSSYFEGSDIYLQDPQVCHWDTKYFNPHRLSTTDLSSCPLVSEVVLNSTTLMQVSQIAQRPDLLSSLSGAQDLEETPQPSCIKSTLKRHSPSCCAENVGGGLMNFHAHPIYGKLWTPVTSGISQSDEPDEFAGGIVADPMGLGKTLTMISLVATDTGSSNFPQGVLDSSKDEKTRTPATLIVVPPPLIGTWENELNTHMKEGAIRHCRHHGKTRIGAPHELEGMHVVLTTYHTVSAEGKTDATKRDSVLFSVKWRRIILDEAHFIRNPKARMAKSVCALDANARWAVTGTPIQNRLSDFAALLQFIRVYPYDEPRHFDADIANLWKTGEEQEAVYRLKRLSQYLLLRRPKDTIDLPARRDLQSPVDFTRDERTVYEEMKMQAIVKVDEALYNDSGSYKPGSYMNVLQQIESLRLFCNLGIQYQARYSQREMSNPVEITPESWSKTAQRAFQAQSEMGPMVCLQCDSALEIAETLLDGDGSPPMVHFASCFRYACPNCTSRSKRAFHCGHQPSCPTALVSLTSDALDDSSGLSGFNLDTASKGLSSKVQTLINDMKSRPADEKCIVFSTWRLTLDMVEKGLNEADISCVRFDGKVPQKDRQPIVERFKTDPNLHVMLLTLSCGAVGLTLTVANRAYLMEPHWYVLDFRLSVPELYVVRFLYALQVIDVLPTCRNPTLEDQALARVHRLGQTKQVTTIRLYIRDSFEEKVMELQESKRSLAGVLLSPHDGGQTDDSNQSELQKLRALL
ncbi:hypothetical protein PG989_007705 [Apiospora arundinis]